MANMNLYLPEALKEEMEPFEKVINWSAVAQEAFRSAITTEKAKNMDTQAIVNRLKATAGPKSTRFQEGSADGRQWAAEYAELDELEALAEFDLDVALNPNSVPAQFTPAQYAAQQIAEAMGGDDFEVIFGEVKLTSAYIRGFVSGTLEVLSAVQTSL